MSETAIGHTLMGGKVHVYRQPNSHFWQCSAYKAGKNRRVSTHQKSLAKAKEFTEDWYLQLRGKLRRGEIKKEKTLQRGRWPVSPRVRNLHGRPAQSRLCRWPLAG